MKPHGSGEFAGFRASFSTTCSPRSALPAATSSDVWSPATSEPLRAGAFTACLEGLWGRCIGRDGRRGKRDESASAQALTDDEFQRRIAFLGQVSLFKRLPLAHFPILARDFRGRTWKSGQVLVENGSPLHSFVLVAEGCAELQVPLENASDQHSVLTLHPGDYFGEKVLDSGGGRVVRSPTRIVACAGLVTLEMGPEEFERFGFRKHLVFPKRRALSRCILNSSRGSEPVHSKTSFQDKLIREALQNNSNLRSLVDLQDDIVQQMVDAARPQKVPAGTRVVQRGEYGGMFYIVESGSFELQLGDAGDQLNETLANGFETEDPVTPRSETVLRQHRKERFLQRLSHSPEASPTRGSPDTLGTPAVSPMRGQIVSDAGGGAVSQGSIGRCWSWASPTGFADSASFGRLGGDGFYMAPDPNTEAKPVTLFADVLQVSTAPSSTKASLEDPFKLSTAKSSKVNAQLPLPNLLRNGDDLSQDKSKSGQMKAERILADVSKTGAGNCPVFFHRSALTGSCLSRSLSCRDKDRIFPVTSFVDHHLGFRGKGECFGELALLYHAPRISNAVATEDSYVWAVSQAQFRRIVKSNQEHKIEKIVNHLGKVDLLQGLLSQEKAELAGNLLTAKFKAGDYLIREGERQDVWYLITRGKCVMSRRTEWSDDMASGLEEELAELESPQHFGERALLRGRPSEFSVRASTYCDEVECLVLDGPTFKELAGHLSAEDFRRAEEDDLLQFTKYKSQRITPKLPTGFLSRLDRESPLPATPRNSKSGDIDTDGVDGMHGPLRLDPSFDRRALDRIGVLGTGAFGLVTLERDPATGQRFALKTVSKAHIVANELTKAVKSERQILSMLDCPFITRLLGTFQDATYLYFLFEPLLGGELHTHMCRWPSRFRDPRTWRFVLACIILAVEHLHERNIIYRDLKPENVLIDSSGYMKLCDFGFAKFAFGKATTLCGTPEYMAPEVIMNGCYDRMVDWWALGVLAFECVCGCTPFLDEEEEDFTSPEIIFANILTTKFEVVDLPMQTPLQIVEFVQGQLQFFPGNRRGIGGAGQVRSHAAFSLIEWELVQNQSWPSPCVPEIKTDAEFALTLCRSKLVTPGEVESGSACLGTVAEDDSKSPLESESWAADF